MSKALVSASFIGVPTKWSQVEGAQGANGYRIPPACKATKILLSDVGNHVNGRSLVLPLVWCSGDEVAV